MAVFKCAGRNKPIHGANRRSRKKYFSSKERLNIAQQSSEQQRRKRSFGSGSWVSGSGPSEFDARPSTSHSISLRKRPSPRQVEDAASQSAGLDVENLTEDQARWFVSLPDKVRKSRFSRKEQISIAVRCKRVLQHSSPGLADEVLRRCLYGGQEANGITSPNRKRGSSVTVATDILVEEGLLEADAFSKHSFDPDTEIYSLYSRPSSSDGENLTAIPLVPELPANDLWSIPRQTRSKSLSESTNPALIALDPAEIEAIPPVPPLPSEDELYSVRPRAFTAASSRSHLMGPVIDSEQETADAAHYQHPNVRRQLRQYLTPSKFDEALEFGFAFENEQRAVSSSASNKPFPIRPAAPYFSEDDCADEDSNNSPEELSPRTPPSNSDIAQPSIRKASFDSSFEIRPSLFTAMKTHKNRSPEGSLGNREMTIHMTLTRRDLRAPNEDVHSIQRPQTSGVDVERVDPLALDTLQVCDDPTGAHGAFAVPGSKGFGGLKKVWRSIRGR